MISGVKTEVSRVRDRTLEMCVPSERWMPEHSIQRTMPRLMETQSTLESEPQSAQYLLPWSASRMRIRTSDVALSVSKRMNPGLSPVVA